MTQAKFLEVQAKDGKGLDGVIGIGVDGFATIHIGWLKVLLDEAGYTYGEVRS